jgi:hypothetical protein
MDRKWVQRATLLWGVLAVATQLWVGLIFVRWFVRSWKDTRPALVSFAQSVNRFSQLKTPALKYPWAGVYFILCVAVIIGLVGWLTISGLREAIAPEPETKPADDSR